MCVFLIVCVHMRICTSVSASRHTWPAYLCVLAILWGLPADFLSLNNGGWTQGQSLWQGDLLLSVTFQIRLHFSNICQDFSGWIQPRVMILFKVWCHCFPKSEQLWSPQARQSKYSRGKHGFQAGKQLGYFTRAANSRTHLAWDEYQAWEQCFPPLSLTLTQGILWQAELPVKW